MNPDDQLFPTADQVLPHALAFARMMLAHTRLEREVQILQDVITGKLGYGEKPRHQARNTDRRPTYIARLIEQRVKEPGLPELVIRILSDAVAPIHAILKAAKVPSRKRNLLTHGDWWRFSPQTLKLTVRSGIKHRGAPPWVDWTPKDIDEVKEAFWSLEAELFKLRRKIEDVAGPPMPPAN
jgi:hypothetical protein